MFNQIKFTKIIVSIRGKVRNIQQFKEFNQEQFNEGTIYGGYNWKGYGRKQKMVKH